MATADAGPGGDAVVTARAASLGGTLTAFARSAQARGPSPFAEGRIYRARRGPARTQARAWRADRPADAALMDHIAQQPAAEIGRASCRERV